MRILNRSISGNSWVVSYFSQVLKKRLSIPRRISGPTHLIVSICDHFEPRWNNVDFQTGLKRIKTWVQRFPEISGNFKDALGYFPPYTFFFPIEEYHPDYLDLLSSICKKEMGEVEVHLHHDGDNAASLKNKLVDFKQTLVSRHGLLSQDKETGETVYGFIHGNWALDNSRPDCRWCGVNNELSILQETGCFADFTMPSAPDCTQTSKINSIYYAVDDPNKPKSHNQGFDLRKGKNERNGLLMVQGPLVFNFKLFTGSKNPTIENGCLAFDYPVGLERVRRWINANIHIRGEQNIIFIKLYSHGCQEKNMEYLLNRDLEQLIKTFLDNFNDGRFYKTHFVSARQMVNIIKAIEDNRSVLGEPLNFKDYKYIKI